MLFLQSSLLFKRIRYLYIFRFRFISARPAHAFHPKMVRVFFLLFTYLARTRAASEQGVAVSICLGFPARSSEPRLLPKCIGKCLYHASLAHFRPTAQVYFRHPAYQGKASTHHSCSVAGHSGWHSLRIGLRRCSSAVFSGAVASSTSGPSAGSSGRSCSSSDTGSLSCCSPGSFSPPQVPWLQEDPGLYLLLQTLGAATPGKVLSNFQYPWIYVQSWALRKKRRPGTPHMIFCPTALLRHLGRCI